MMNRSGITAVALAAAVMQTACTPATADRQQAAKPQQSTYRRPWSDDDVVKPTWIADPTRSGTVVAAWGSAPHDPQGGRGAMRDAALLSARRELANMVRVRVQSVLKDYLSESGGSAGSAVLSYAESTSRAIANESIAGSAQRDEWIHPKTGELYVWAVVDPAFSRRMAQEIAEAATASPHADAHIRAKLASDKGFAELDRMLDASFATGR